jgi:CubicO group peptidase (beta-lactamase class C family)
MTIATFLQRECDLGSFAGAAWAVGTPAGIESEGAVGRAVSVPVRLPATLDTIWDCASLTKPLVTTTLILQLIADGELRLQDTVLGLPYTVQELLTHTSGLRPWLPLYALGDPLAAIREQGPECARGTRAIYSDLNFILLWMALRECGNFERMAHRHLFEPLGLHTAMLHPGPEWRARLAATEWGQLHERKMCAERKITFDGWREGVIWGETHDGNSHYLGNGCAGNAGLFASARAVFRIVQGLMTGELVPDELLALATTNHTPSMEDGRGLGWQIATGSVATSMLSPGSWGHTGFTGTSAWVDRDRQRIMVLLTNRVHPCAAPIAMQRIRGELHKLALA